MLLLLRKSLLHPLHAVWWLVVGGIILLVGLFPRAFDALGHALGVTYPPALYLAIAVVVVLIRILVADLERCKMMLQQRRMNQHLARLALRVRQLELGSAAGSASTASNIVAPGVRAVVQGENTLAGSKGVTVSESVVASRPSAAGPDGSHE